MPSVKTSLILAVPAVCLATVVVMQSPVAAGAGRYKLDGNKHCYWDPNDSGPDQCRPAGEKPKGRYKLDGNRNCYWDANDNGPNQCEPPRR
ncbi:MAG: hypothetical protein AB7H96_18160 [Vicinamibacterales bacterium]